MDDNNRKRKLDDLESVSNQQVIKTFSSQSENDELIKMISIPNNLWKYLFSFLDSNSLMKMSCVCKSFNNILTQPSGINFWKNAVKRYYPELFDSIQALEKIVENPYHKFIRSDLKKRENCYGADINLEELVSFTKMKSFYFITYISYKVWVIEKDENFSAEDFYEEKFSLKKYCKMCKKKNKNKKEKEDVEVESLPENFIMVGKINENCLDRLEGHPDKSWVIESFSGQLSYMFLNGFSYLKSFSSLYMGNSKMGRLSGFGKITFGENKFYEGEFVDENFSGKGTFGNSNGHFYSDQWVDGTMKKGVFSWNEGGYYEGEFDENKYFSGEGTYYSDYGAIKRSKNWVNGNIVGNFEYIDLTGHLMNLTSTSAESENFENFYEQLNEDIKKCESLELCTRAFTQKNFFPQLFYHCLDCKIVENEGVCQSCANLCHKGHKLSAVMHSLSFYCDCPSKMLCNCYLFNHDYRSNFKNNPVSKKVTYENQK